jgi:hypothetical protein
MRPRNVPLLVVPWLILGAVAPSAQQGRLPREVEAVRKHILERDYPELFGSKAYRTKIEDILVTDLDRDGNIDVVILFVPHYRQSAPIVIFRLSKDLRVTRVKEGLAPGPLVPLSGAYLDSHTLGQAVDFTMDAKGGPGDREKVFTAVITSRFGGVVEYKTFIHADGRSGEVAYVDMRHTDVPNGKDTCAEFEFARVEGIAAGVLENEPTKVYLAARVGSELWLYHIAEFLPNGLMRKEIRVEKLPTDFSRFAPGAKEILLYQTTAGDVRPLFRGRPR